MEAFWGFALVSVMLIADVILALDFGFR